jgi:hypothetical protein
MNKSLTFYQLISAWLSHAMFTVPSQKRIQLLILGILCLVANTSKAQQFTWTGVVGNSSQKTAVLADKMGYSYVLSAFTGSITIGKRSFKSFGASDLLLVRYKPSGEVEWSRQMGGAGDEQVGDLSFIGDGTVVVVGSFHNTIKFEDYNGLQVSPLTSVGSSDVFFAWYSISNGWMSKAFRIGGTGTDYGNGIAVDKNYNMYLTGSFTGTIQIKYAFTTFSLTSIGNSDIFMLKFDNNGLLQIARKIGSTGYDLGTAIAVDPANGDIYLTGGYSPITNLFTTNILVAKYNSLGTMQWAKTSGSANNVDMGNDIMLGPGGVYVTGYFAGNITFDATTLTSNGSSDAFLVMYPYNSGGKTAWAQKFGGKGWDEGQSLVYQIWNDEPGEPSVMYMGGTFTGTATFGQTQLTATEGTYDRDMFLTRISPDGKAEWTRQIGSLGIDYGRGNIALSASNVIYYTGHFGHYIILGDYPWLGPGNLLTKITLPTVTDFKLINAATDMVLSTNTRELKLNYFLMGTNQFNIQANTVGSAGSVKFEMNFALAGGPKIDNSAPFTWAGDTPKSGGGTDYFASPFIPKPGFVYTLIATPYSGPNGTGIAGLPHILKLDVSDNPELSGLTLMNAATDAEIGKLTDGYNFYFSKMGTNQVNIRATTNSGTIGSVKFVLDGVSKIDNGAPYTWAGDKPKVGGIDYLPFTATHGIHYLTVTVYSEANATGKASKTYNIHFYFVGDKTFRIAAESEPELQPLRFSVAPNPFSGHTSLLFTSSEDGLVTVEVYNMQGIRVKHIYEGTLEAGKPYKWEFDADSLPAGIYIGRLQMGSQVLQQKLVLSK